MAVTSKPRLLVAPTIALVSLAVLAGCGSTGSKDSSAASSSATTKAAIVAVKSGSASATPSEPASAKASASETATVEAVIPDGYKQVTAPKNKITFAVPEDWVELNSEAFTNADEVQAFLDEFAASSGLPPEQLKASVSQLDLMANSRIPDANGFAPNVNVGAAPLPAKYLPTRVELEPIISTLGGTIGDYQEVDTPLGKGAKQSYTAEMAGFTVHGVFLLVPSGTGSGYSILTISSGDTASANALADTFAASVTKAP